MARLEIRALRVLHVGPLDLTLDRGETVAVEGPSGSGKSLLMRALADLEPHGGSVALDGVEQQDVPASYWRRRVGLLPSESAWWTERVADHFPPGWRGGAGEFAALDLASELLDAPVERLSSGERQRLALLRMLAREPAALLLDEPTANLDPASSARVEAMVRDYLERTGACALWVAHDGAQRGRMARRAIRVERDGKVA